ncbi:MAG TPA: CerR family C-terminal domain-containing protein [Alphaproteobacteria bacterium]|nr:CerR family C-terminal domain-containing protein [Alphaproteobacteria bacterium]
MSNVERHYRPGTYQRGEDTRRRILDAAIEIFAVEGYDGASTRTLAERAGVNLPAIQYYFGSKEGLYRAVIDYMVRQMETRMNPIAERVRTLLDGGEPSPRELLDHLCEMLDAFVLVVFDKEHQQSRRLLWARSEVEETAALDPLHERGKKQIFEPCAMLIARLLALSVDDEQVVLRTIAMIGQVVIFCNKATRRALGWSDFGEYRIAAIQKIVRRHAEAIFSVEGSRR